MKLDIMLSYSAARVVTSNLGIAMVATWILVAGNVLWGQTISQSASTTQKHQAEKIASTRHITVIQNGKVLYSSNGRDSLKTWKTLRDVLGDIDTNIRMRIESAFRNVPKDVRISVTGGTVVVSVDKDGDGDAERIVIDLSDSIARWREVRLPELRKAMRIYADIKPVERLLHRLHERMSDGMWDSSSENFASKKAEDLAREADNLRRRAEALRKEAEAMRLEAEAINKRSEALQLEAEARKENKSTTEKKPDKTKK
ncbi:MAG: hypothetical protein RML40_12200 [Bacteroidota bacterium]|nr:hypothetical protein [Candidatus Kapabacteria bacterium]MDW8221277.1 hypothetical protein [Bacteroidota bacterium]